MSDTRTLRQYRKDDLEELIRLFYETVQSATAGEYTEEERNAWVPSAESVDREAWHASLSAHFTLVAEENGMLIGFGDMDGDYFDRLYVHKDFQRQGVAASLADALEDHAWNRGADNITVHASLTARPFFERRGYVVKKEQRVQRHAVSLTNFLMEKQKPKSGGKIR